MSDLNQKRDESVSLVSWNVNGIRAVHKKGFIDWLAKTKPDILCLQEIRATIDQIDLQILNHQEYYSYWNSGVRAGYAGTALLSREKPLSVRFGLDDNDREGRVIIAHFPHFTLINCYFPNGSQNSERLSFKLGFYEAFFDKCRELSMQGHTVVFCGDLNTAHQEIDLARPKANKRKSGFLSKERNWIDRLIESGYVDTFRYFHPNTAGRYTWWANTMKSKERNIGWRFDYFFVPKQAITNLIDAFTLQDVSYSDHCPIGIRLCFQE